MKKIVTLIIVILVTVSCSKTAASDNTNQTVSEKKKQTWTCSMHPQIRQPMPGKCPICAMELIPTNTSPEQKHKNIINLSPVGEKLQTALPD